MRGGGDAVVYKNENVTLEYSSGAFSSFRNMLGKKKDNFNVELTFNGSVIYEMPFKDEDKTLKDAIKEYIDHVSKSGSFSSFFIPLNSDQYNFILTMKKNDGKIFKVKFIVRVKKYNFKFYKKKDEKDGLVHIELISHDGSPGLILGVKDDLKIVNTDTDTDEPNGIIYFSGDGTNYHFNPYKISEPFTIVQESDLVEGKNKEKKYTFPAKYRTTPNDAFFVNVFSKMITKVTEVYKKKLMDLAKKLVELEKESQQPPQQLIVPTVNNNPDVETQ
jgi:hypothetical protein